MQNQKWYHNDTEERYFIDGSQPDGWRKGRLPKEKTIDRLVKIISKEELYQYYILENHTFPETMARFGLSVNGHLRQILYKYDIHKDRKSACVGRSTGRSHENYIAAGKKSAKTQKETWKNKPQAEKEEWSKCRSEQMANRTFYQKEMHKQKIIDSWESRPQKEKDEINRRRSESCKKAWSNPDLIKKQHDTYKENKKNRICRSIAEQEVYDKLISKYKDLIYDTVIDDRYPYYCDFYIPSLDLFIEFNAHPSHGNYPYIEGDKSSLEECYKLYGDWLDVYTKRDPEKVRKAIESKINYLMIYPTNSIEMNYQINQYRYKDIIDLILQ